MPQKPYLVFTAIFGNYDCLEEIPPEAYEPELLDYICFSDRPYRSETYRVEQVPCSRTDQMMNRYYKVMIDIITRGRYKASIYLDGNVRVKDRLSGLFDVNEDLTVHDHLRTCIYEEAEAIIQKNKDSRAAVDKWVQRLEREEYPRDNGLYWNGVLVRKHSDRMRVMSQEWWEMLNEYSYRDQLTLPYLLRKHAISVRCLHRELDKHGVFDSPIFYYDGRHKDDARSFEWLPAFFSRKLRES
jgi:hypothetical protein